VASTRKNTNRPVLVVVAVPASEVRLVVVDSAVALAVFRISLAASRVCCIFTVADFVSGADNDQAPKGGSNFGGNAGGFGSNAGGGFNGGGFGGGANTGGFGKEGSGGSFGGPR